MGSCSLCCRGKFGPTHEELRSAEMVDADTAMDTIKQHKAAGNIVGLIKFVDNQSRAFAAYQKPFDWVKEPKHVAGITM